MPDPIRHRILHRLAHDAPIFSVAFSPNGGLLAAGSADGSLTMWGLASGESLFVARSHDSRLLAIDFTSGGEQCVTGGRDGRVVHSNVKTGAEVRRKQLGERVTIEGLSFSHEGSVLATCGEDHTGQSAALLWLLDPASLEVVGRLNSPH